MVKVWQSNDFRAKTTGILQIPSSQYYSHPNHLTTIAFIHSLQDVITVIHTSYACESAHLDERATGSHGFFFLALGCA